LELGAYIFDRLYRDIEIAGRKEMSTEPNAINLSRKVFAFQ